MIETPEAQGAALQKTLDEELGIFSPRLGVHPDRFKQNAAWLCGGMLLATIARASSMTEAWLNFGLTSIAVVGLAVTFAYGRLYWRTVARARADHCVRVARWAEQRTAAPSPPKAD